MSGRVLSGVAERIDGVIRIETAPLEQTAPILMAKMRSVYPHHEVFGQYCTVNEYVDCPPDELFGYLANARSLEEWTYTLRGFTPTDEPGLWLAYDRLLPQTQIFTRAVANARARTVHHHCAWESIHLWMMYLMRVIDAQAVVDKPGSVVVWTNCRHPLHRRNPGHRLELNNLKMIAEYRHRNGLPMTPDWMK
ncbi:hypothetical protein [Mycobacterium shimoidei]|jgi:hypothetical protein|uniref:Uncharacterized protein n=1 Tax=Mycobacterium shimoidei TaxID=29313 RepID=A0A1E3TJ88_MYCSH|nr:hypothetical protein [Mycobacterium shimoidei]MCV7260572.1 SRPBCC family protein [Mycobacterium shimoidei]ODR13725.1 hypothetical protein BHQ16_08540 [Mycobacterium shimoidei]ORW76283.1 hypothetical protein AWC26_21365 [Mycobacterium shimoidei]SRX91989.1 hypothetical protein MSP7336_00210 [Mycobacterium shimoidei]